jgi:hypothetical protein
MLSRARPRHKLEMEGDSDVIIFSANTSPGKTLRARPYGLGRQSQRLVKLGDQLIEYAAAPAAERTVRAKAIEQDLQQLENNLKAAR